MSDSVNKNWLERASSIRLLWRGFAFVLAITVLLQLVVKVKGYFVVDAWFGFGAVFGFFACLLMVLLAKLLGKFLKREEHYYEADQDD